MASEFQADTDFAILGRVLGIDSQIYRIGVSLVNLQQALQERDSEGFTLKVKQLRREQADLKMKFGLLKRFDLQAISEENRVLMARVKKLVSLKFFPEVEGLEEGSAAAIQRPPIMTYMRRWLVDKLRSEEAEAEADDQKEEVGTTVRRLQEDDTTVCDKTDMNQSNTKMEESSGSGHSKKEEFE